MAVVSSVTARQVIPNMNTSMYVVTYNKTGEADYLTTSINSPMRLVKFAMARDDTASAEDPLTYSGAVITFSAGTDEGRVLVVGTC